MKPVPMTPAPQSDAPLGEWALWYASHGWPIFPCHGKEPVGRLAPQGFKNATTDLDVIANWWRQWPDMNIATPTGLSWWALDVDARHDGPESLRSLEQSYGELPRTITSLTGSGGGSCHLLWQVGALPIINKANKKRPELGSGLDVQGPGSYIILPPSIHPLTKQAYCWESDFGPDDLDPQAPPAWLEALVTEPAPPHTSESLAEPTSPLDGPIPDGERNITLTSLAGAMRHKGATYPAILAALEAENQRCVPPLDHAELEAIAHSIQRYAPAPSLAVRPPVGWSANGVTGDEHTSPQTSALLTQWTKDLFSYKNGELKQNAFNIGQTLRFHPYWHIPERKLWYDVIRGYHMCGPYQISKALCTKATQWFGGEMRLPISNIELLRTCMESEAAENPRDLLKDQLLALPAWDQKPRLETWLQEVTGAEDNAYTRYLSRALPVSMVARVLVPGCPCRLVVILEGKENIGKSHLVEAIASPDWYTILSMSLEGKDSHIMLHKYWIAELAELDSLSRTEEARMKAFVTMETDTYVPKYSNVAISIPRRTIFMGTTNDGSGYLKGQTGNTRYFPLKVGERIDVEGFTAIRDQIFAEALAWQSSHADTWWHEPAEVTLKATEERELRRQASDYEQPLHEWLEYGRFNPGHFEEGYNEAGQLIRKQVAFTPNETSWPEIAKWFLKIDAPERWKDRSLQLQIASALKALGWVSSPVWRFGRTTRIWTLPEPGEGL